MGPEIKGNLISDLGGLSVGRMDYGVNGARMCRSGRK